MKPLISFALIILFSLNLSAQYKKAGFFEKEGRTYELGSQVYAMGKGNGHPIGYKLSFGRDKDGTRLFTSSDLHFIPSHKYSYSTVGENDEPVTVMGTSKLTIAYGISWAFHLLNNDGDEKPRVQPFVVAGINTLLYTGIKEESYSTMFVGFPKRQTSEQSLSFGINGGVGCLLNLSSKLALKIQGGYSRQFNLSVQNWDNEVRPFFLFDSHVFGGVGLRLRIAED